MKLKILVILILQCLVSFGHGGHGHYQDSYMHYLVSFVHIVPIAGFLILLWFLYKSIDRRKYKSPVKK